MKRCRHSATKEVLRKFSSLFGFYMLERDSSLVEIGYLTKDDCTFIREEVRKLCAQLKDELVGIVDSIGPPDEVLNSAIGGSDGNLYERFISTIFSAPRAFERPHYWKEIRGRE
jgi:acyl-CoA oxidase